MTATDWDDGNNGRIEYSIPGSMAVTFHVDQRGVVSAQDSVDRERYDNFRFPVLAVDRGVPRRTGSTLVVVSVADVDDEKPRFISDSDDARYHFNVTENEPAETKVGYVSAEDRDGLTENNAFIYAFDGGSSSTNEFNVDPHTGAIITRRPLDREVTISDLILYRPTGLFVTKHMTLANRLDCLLSC